MTTAFDPAAHYHQGDTVTYLGKTYRTGRATLGRIPPTPPWDEVTAGGAGGGVTSGAMVLELDNAPFTDTLQTGFASVVFDTLVTDDGAPDITYDPIIAADTLMVHTRGLYAVSATLQLTGDPDPNLFVRVGGDGSNQPGRDTVDWFAMVNAAESLASRGVIEVSGVFPYDPVEESYGSIAVTYGIFPFPLSPPAIEVSWANLVAQRMA